MSWTEAIRKHIFKDIFSLRAPCRRRVVRVLRRQQINVRVQETARAQVRNVVFDDLVGSKGEGQRRRSGIEVEGNEARGRVAG
jgi:hypothetical protein